jgi:hypothetical protein
VIDCHNREVPDFEFALRSADHKCGERRETQRIALRS